MGDLVGAVLKEAQRRGMFVDVIDGMVNVTPRPQDESEPAKGRGGGTTLTEKAKLAEFRKKDEIGEP